MGFKYKSFYSHREMVKKKDWSMKDMPKQILGKWRKQTLAFVSSKKVLTFEEINVRLEESDK